MRFSFSSVYVVILSHLRGTPLWSAIPCLRDCRFRIADCRLNRCEADQSVQPEIDNWKSAIVIDLQSRPEHESNIQSASDG
jgi:hypothetical protein